ncbi:hypothetical protein ACAG39_07810 [Caldicellulosiruptoraceae bacterium PP1]
MRKSIIENIKSIVLGILIILSIYLYMIVFFQNPIESYFGFISTSFLNQDDNKNLTDISIITTINPRKVIYIENKSLLKVVFSNDDLYKSIINGFIDEIKRNILTNNYKIDDYYADFKKDDAQKYINFEYSYFLNIHLFSQTLFNKDIFKNMMPFFFDKVYIYKSDGSLKICFMNSTIQKAVVISINDGASWIADIMDKIDSQNSNIFSYASSLGWSDLAPEDALIPIKLSNLRLYEVKVKASESKKNILIKRLFGDTLFTRTSIDSSGNSIITDERKELVLKRDGSYQFTILDKLPENKMDIRKAILFYLANFYFGDEVYINSIYQFNNETEIIMNLKIDGIDAEVFSNKEFVRIVLNDGYLTKIEGILLDIEKGRRTYIDIDGVSAIDKLKETNGNIYMHRIDLKYILSNNLNSYPLWEIKTKNGVIYIDAINN